MKKKVLLMRISAGILASFLAMGSVYAETNPTISQPVGTNKKGVVIPKTEPTGNINVPAGRDNATTASGAELRNAPTSVTVGAHEAIAPYLGQTVTKVSITGNSLISTNDVMTAVHMKPGTKLTEEGLNSDLQSLYEMGWFYDLAPSFQRVPEGVQVTYHVSENPLYKGLNVYGNKKMPTDKINKIFDMAPGKILNIRQVNTRVQRLEAEYNQQGYILARVTDLKMRPDGMLGLYINEGIVEGFKVKGNVKTKDYVILRELKVKKGEPFNAKDARRSMQRIYNLGYFEDVNMKLNPGQEPNSVEMEVTVVEGNTGTFGIGAGYSDADGFIGMISLGDKNFRGTGDSINLRWEFGGHERNNKNYELSYTKPWIDKKETSATFTIYNMTNEYADYNHDADEVARYDKNRKGQELTLSRKTDNEFISNYITLKNRKDTYDGTVDGYDTQYYESSYDSDYYKEFHHYTTAQERRDENFGSTRSITLARVFDSRDNIYDPHEGKRNSYSVERSGFGSDFNFTKFMVDYRYYYRTHAENVIAVELGAGYASGDMPLSQRFSMGGADTLRGYKDDQYRGNSMLRGTVEYRVPLVKKVQGVIFVDSGYAWDKRYDERNFDLGLIKVGYGLGIRINSPLGPVKLDYGRGENGSRFHFSFGGQF
jgi:outer membrane protein insertion porin family